MSEEKFKLPGSSYEELIKIIKAYKTFSAAVPLYEVSKLINLHRTNISRNVGFLIALGILESGKHKKISPTGVKLAQSLNYPEMKDEIKNNWQEIVQQNDFLSKTITAIKIRNGMDQQTLEAHIAYSAGQPKKSQIMTGARTVIEILKVSELILEIDGKYLAGSNQLNRTETANLKRENIEDEQIIENQTETTRFSIEKDSKQIINLNINIQLNIDYKQSILNEIGPSINSFIQSIRENNK